MAWELKVEELVTATHGSLLQKTAQSVRGVATDTRKDCTGQLFVALRGDNFDAHDFLPKAVEQGAAVLLIERNFVAVQGLPVTVVQVDDTLLALQKLARYWRRKNSARIIGVTGTNGKTTSKDFARQILSARFKVCASQGSLNNHWGVPLSLLSIQPEDEIAVIEMGMNHAGEIKTLVEIAVPDVVGVTMVGRGHLEGLGSIEAVASAKEEIYHYAPPAAIFVFNLDNPFTRSMYERYRQSRREAKLITFASDQTQAAQVSLRSTKTTLEGMTVEGVVGKVPVHAQVPVFGTQNVTNLMMAASFALAVGMPAGDVAASLSRCQTSWGRNQLLTLESGAKLLFDAYNANPESMGALLTNLGELAVEGAKVAVLGEMLELGENSALLHYELGAKAAQVGFAHIWFVGPHGPDFAAGLKARGFNNNLLISDVYEESLAKKIANVIGSRDIVAIKGSRGVGLERFLEVVTPLNYQAKS